MKKGKQALPDCSTCHRASLHFQIARSTTNWIAYYRRLTTVCDTGGFGRLKTGEGVPTLATLIGDVAVIHGRMESSLIEFNKHLK